MKRMQSVFNYISSNSQWLLSLGFVCSFFIYLAWIAYPQVFFSLLGLMIFVTMVAVAFPILLQIRRQKQAEKAFRSFLLKPDEVNEYLLYESSPVIMHSFIQALGQHLRAQQEEVAESMIRKTDYEHYIESWVHEIKKPISLITLMLDNRKSEMTPFVRTRMLYASDQMRQDIDQILYFSRLDATHKDYLWEQESLLSLCRSSVLDNVTLLEEAGFVIAFQGDDHQVITDKRGMMFILGQIISNSVKYAKHQDTPSLLFDVKEDTTTDQIILSISDNGIGIATSDVPFIFDKGFTGEQGSYLSRSTGMGLFLVQKMAHDLSISLHVVSTPKIGTTISFLFPKVDQQRSTHEDAN